jgi:ankyrin repeat protein
MEVSMNRSLPSKPSLEHLKKQAKELLAAYGSGQEDAVRRVRTYFDPGVRITLAKVQLVLAREHGFASWSELKRQIEHGEAPSVDDFVQAALDNGPRAAELWKKHRAGWQFHPAASALAGDIDALVLSPEIVNGPVGPKNRPLLTYTCFSRLALNSEFESGILATARKLIEAGADPNSYFLERWAGEDVRETALYGAAGVLNHVGLTRMLLESGADPNDGSGDGYPYKGESVYHACEHPGNNECLRLLFEVGASQAAKDYCLLRKLDFEDSEGVLLFLDYGANPNYGNPRTALSHALLRNRSIEMIKLLLDHGADPNQAGHDGPSPYVLARRFGKRAAADLLVQRGANPSLSPYDELLSAAAEGNPDKVQDIANQHPEVLLQTGHYGRQEEGGVALGSAGEVLHDLARAGQAKGLQALIELGMNPGAVNRFNETPLHWACLAGQSEAARVLVEAGAPINTTEINHGSDPIGWAYWGSEFWKEPHGDYVATVRYMLDVGGRLATLVQGSPEVREFLRSRGVPDQ